MATSGGSDGEEVDKPINNVIPSFSFSGCGFLGVYHVGVAACLRDHSDVVNRREIRFAGASAGAIVATSLLCDIDFGEVTRLLLALARTIRNRESLDLGSILRDLMHKCLPEDAHVKLRKRLYICVTVLQGMRRALITDFHSKEHLIECLIASSFVPGFVGWLPPLLDERDFISVPSAVPAAAVHRTHDEEEDFLLDDDELDGCTTPQGRSYVGMLVRLCYLGWTTTSKLVRKVPGCQHFLDMITPDILSNADEFVDALMLEMMSNRYATFDGGFSDNNPVFDANTVIICPFSGESDICPRDSTGIDFNIDLACTSMHCSEDNIFRLNHALNPLDPETLHALCVEGYNECLRFLHKKDLLSCKKHLMTRATLSTSPCNIGHAHCTCDICKRADEKIRKSLSCVDCQKIRKKALLSELPKDVTNEFLKAIEEERRSQSSAMTRTYWQRLVSVLWWCAETMYASTIKLSDLSTEFSKWLLRFYDNLASIARFSYLTVRKQRKLVRFILSSLRNTINASLRLRSKLDCRLRSAPSMVG